MQAPIQRQLRALERQAKAAAGTSVMMNSTHDLSRVLFDVLKLQAPKTAKDLRNGQISTSAEVRLPGCLSLRLLSAHAHPDWTPGGLRGYRGRRMRVWPGCHQLVNRHSSSSSELPISAAQVCSIQSSQDLISNSTGCQASLQGNAACMALSPDRQQVLREP